MGPCAATHSSCACSNQTARWQSWDAVLKQKDCSGTFPSISLFQHQIITMWPLSLGAGKVELAFFIWCYVVLLKWGLSCGTRLYCPELGWACVGFQRSWAHFSPIAREVVCISWRLQCSSLGRSEARCALQALTKNRWEQQKQHPCGAQDAVADSHQEICYSQILTIMMLKIAELLEMSPGEDSLLYLCILFALITQQNK